MVLGNAGLQNQNVPRRGRTKGQGATAGGPLSDSLITFQNFKSCSFQPPKKKKKKNAQKGAI